MRKIDENKPFFVLHLNATFLQHVASCLKSNVANVANVGKCCISNATLSNAENPMFIGVLYIYICKCCMLVMFAKRKKNIFLFSLNYTELYLCYHFFVYIYKKCNICNTQIVSYFS